ncbi:MAG: tetratricopeptide repeat protein [Kiritimatiellae bacterium]|nr:tetratricopeptide repeat protein [Kiritimatiellia bacterium]
MREEGKKRFQLLGLVGVFCLVRAGPAGADVPGMITTTGGRQIVGMIRWQPASKQYVITTRENVTMKLTPREVTEIKVQPPAELEVAARTVEKGDYASAIPVLEKIMSDYAMLQWDATAAKHLVKCYLATKAVSKALTACEKAIESNPAVAVSKEFAPMYWETLIQAEQFTRLEKALTEAVEKSQDRELVAIAQIKRGDMDKKKGDTKKALVDGYLRTVVFFQAVKEVQPEALYKAMKCFEELGQQSYAEKMRNRLLADYPESSYSERVKSGS